MFSLYFSVNSQPIFVKFCKDYGRVTRQIPQIFYKKIVQKLDHFMYSFSNYDVPL